METREDLFDLALPKWPAFIVRGSPVTKEQAMEIIVRTDGLDFISNDRDFERDLNEVLVGVRAAWLDKDFPRDKVYAVKESLGVLPLDYTQNSRILSSWIGGAHGWCDWNGRIGCNNYNIGKWPSVREVFAEWEIVAKAFPYLSLDCQLLSAETCEANAQPVVNFSVSHGVVGLFEPEGLLDVPQDDAMRNVFGLMNPLRERGCTIDMFREAVEICRSKALAI